MANLEQYRLVEATLFIAGRPVKIEDLIKLIEAKNREELDEVIEKISKNLEERNSFLEIVQIEDEYLMRIKPEIKRDLGDIETRKSLPDDLIKLLAVIALKQPIKWGDIRKIYRGKNIREKFEELERKGFIKVNSEKRTKILTTTPHFINVFDLEPKNMKSDILHLLTKRISQRVIKPPKISEKESEKKEEELTEAEMEEIEKKYYELIERLEREREEERKRLEEEARKKAEKEALMVKLILDPMTHLFNKKKKEKQNKDKTEEINRAN